MANKPVLFYGIEALVKAGIRDLGIIVGETRAEIEEAVGDGSRWGRDVRVTYIDQPEPLNRKLFAGIFLKALSTLMYEILLTRIFSVTMGYHFAFMAVSIAMFGMTAGAIFVYLYPKFFGQNEIEKILARNSFLFSLAIVLSFLFHVFVPFVHSLSFTGFIVMVSTYTVISIPFIFSGICICLLLTRYPESVNKLYASDLIVAALGCILVVSLISISGGPTAVFFTAFIASLVPLIFSSGKRLLRKALIFTLALGSFAVVHTFMVNGQAPLIRLFWVRGDYEPKPLYEKWNSFSRVNIGLFRNPLIML